MSAQALNGSSNNGYVVSSTVGVATRDASDVTRQLKERLIYNGFKNGSTITPGGANKLSSVPILNPAGVNHVPGNSEWSWLPYGNQFRLSYLFGKMKNSTISCTVTTVTSSAVTYTISGNPATLGFGKTGAYATVSGGTINSKNQGTFAVSSVTSNTIVLANTANQSDTGSGFISLCPAGLFNGNGPALPGKSTSVGS